jgi:hypothetical protein
MKTNLKDLFTAHPQSVDESYFEHLLFAGKFSGQLFLAGFAALIHAMLPFLFEKTAGNLIKDMYQRIHNR